MSDKAKNLRKGASNVKLHAGGGIRFGFMRQNNLSGRTLSVTDVSSYIFDNDSFASYQLRDEDTDVNMILAEGERPQDAYLALSLPLKDKWFSSLFAALPPKQWTKLKPDDKVAVAADSVLIPQGWLVNQYRHVLTTKGRKVDGDFRHTRHSELAEFYTDPFDYVLLVSDNGEYAIELEKYENGTVRIFATVYRPVSDISESTQFQRPYIVANNSAEARQAKPEETGWIPAVTLKDPDTNLSSIDDVTLATRRENTAFGSAFDTDSKTNQYEITEAANQAKSIQEESAATPPPRIPPPLTLVPTRGLVNEAVETIVKNAPPTKAPSESTITELVETALAEVITNDAKPSPFTSVSNILLHEEPNEAVPIAAQTKEASPPSNNMLACDVSLAANLIEEARRNKLSMADVIRKVIDLPRKIEDRIYVPFDLTDEEYIALAKRYGVSATDAEAVQKRIVEELRLFAGLD